MKTNDIRLSLEGPAFASLKDGFDCSVRRAVGDMMSRHVDEAVITLKLVIKLDTVSVSKGNAVIDKRKPSFKHDITTVLTIKDKESGKRKLDEALVWDDELHDWVLRPIDEDQTSLFDDENEEDYEDIVDQDETTYKELPDGKPALLPPPAKKETILSDDFAFLMLRQFIGNRLEVVEEGGEYFVRTSDGRNVVSSALSKENPFYCDKEKMKPHVGHNVCCVAYGEDIANISIECEDCNEVIYDMDKPGTISSSDDDEEDDAPGDNWDYETPEE